MEKIQMSKKSTPTIEEAFGLFIRKFSLYFIAHTKVIFILHRRGDTKKIRILKKSTLKKFLTPKKR